jgi:uncharacterized SAM-binding protein YcdF (DUF218 family)
VVRAFLSSLVVRATLLGVLVLLLVAWVAGLVWFAGAIPGQRDADEDRPVDAIVVLTGGSERIRAGLSLLEAGLGEALFISGVPEQVAADDLWQAFGVAPSAAVADRVVLGHAAADTLGNAEETAAWVRKRGYRSLRLVTAAYHMRRALLEFRSLMPGMTLIPHPVFPPHVKQDEWWRFPGTTLLLAREYTKYLVAWARLSVRGPAPASALPAKESP